MTSRVSKGAKISTIKSSQHCGVGDCISSVIPALEYEDDPTEEPSDRRLEQSYITLYKCLRESLSDPDIFAVQFDSIMNIGDIISSYNARIRDKIIMFDEHLTEYCRGFYTYIYQTFVVRVLGHQNYAHARDSFTAMMDEYSESPGLISTWSRICENPAIKNIFFDILLLKEFLHGFYKYSLSNHSMIDLLTAGTGWDRLADPKLDRRADNSVKSPIYNPHYKPGCNCFCGTVTMGVFLRLLAKNVRIPMRAEQVIFYTDYRNDQAHIALGINLEPDLPLYIETTCTSSRGSDLLNVTELSRNMQHSISIVRQSNNYIRSLQISNMVVPIDTNQIPLIILHNRLSLPGNKIAVWKQYGADVIDDMLFDNIIANSMTFSPVERLARLHRFISRLTDSTLAWESAYTCLVSLIDVIASYDSTEAYKRHTSTDYLRLIGKLKAPEKIKSSIDSVISALMIRST
jgi:hypothetical protein